MWASRNNHLGTVEILLNHPSSDLLIDAQDTVLIMPIKFSLHFHNHHYILLSMYRNIGLPFSWRAAVDILRL